MVVTMTDELLKLEGISKNFGGLKALNRVDLTVKEGTITALIGPNGAGKTTLVNIISGVYGPSEGMVSFAGKKISGLPSHKIAEIGISRTFQLTKLFEGMTVLENVMVGGHAWTKKCNFFRTVLNLPSVQREETRLHQQAMDMLKLTDIENLATEQAGNLAHGQQRLLEMARAMTARPKLILLDEPAAGLNPHEEDRLREALKAIVKSGVTILLIEHHMRLVMNVSDWVHVLDLGSKIAEGPPAKIGRDTEVIRAYLGKEY